MTPPAFPVRTWWHDPVMDERDREHAPSAGAAGSTWRERVAHRLRLAPVTHRRVVDPAREHANLVASLTTDGRHLPTLDVDHAVRCVPSRTPGHHHVYIDVPMRWWRYRVLLFGLRIAGVIEPGYYHASVRRRMTHLRASPIAFGADDDDIPF